jgi:hypothetical protein
VTAPVVVKLPDTITFPKLVIPLRAINSFGIY